MTPNTKRFRSPTGSPIHLSMTSGHTAVVSPDEWTPLDQRFHRQAIAEGCDVEGVARDDDAPAQTPARLDLIAAGIKDMLLSNKPDDFNGDGRPDVRKLSARIGFAIDRSERDAAWAKLRMASGSADSGDDED